VSATHLSTYRVAIYLLREWKLHPGVPIKLTTTALRGRGVSRRDKPRAVDELERMGLIQVKKRFKGSPTITILVGE
jgi:hypothetical protein